MSNIGETSSNRPGNRIQNSDPGSPLTNLSVVRTRMDSLQQFLSESVSSNTLISKNQMDMVSSEISSAIHQIIINGAALLASSNPLPPPPRLPPPQPQAPSPSDPKHPDNFSEKTIQKSEYEVVEIDAVELLAEHMHFCDICGKGFKRDANLRMHMRAHGNEYKTAEALAKPDKSETESGRERRFSCPFEGCNRNKRHGKFRALKSVTCVKNHFKRSHCPKTYWCERCNKKSFSVLSDLKSHYKHCGGVNGRESRWRCSCGTTFSRKDKLFGHVALFEGHMPLVDEKMKGVIAMDEDDDHDGDGNDDDDNVEVVEVEEENHNDIIRDGNGLDDGFFEGLLDEFGSIENYCLQDVLGSSAGNELPNWNGEFL